MVLKYDKKEGLYFVKSLYSYQPTSIYHLMDELEDVPSVFYVIMVKLVVHTLLMN
jgi:hypothetical protein